MHIVIIILFMSLASGVARADNSVFTTLSKLSDGTWSVRYEATEPVSQLELQRSPDQSRAERWLLNDGFHIYFEGEREYLKRVDSANFTSVVAELTPPTLR